MPIAPAAVELLRAVAPTLDRCGRWYVFGAQAVVIHGVPRLSADVDITIALERMESGELAGELAGTGFELRVRDPEFVRATSVLPVLHTATGLPLDIVFAASGLEESFLARARPVDIGGFTVPVIDVTDLVIAKILAGRTKEIEDAAALWRARRTEIDVRHVRDALRQLEEALSVGDLISTFDRLAHLSRS